MFFSTGGILWSWECNHKVTDSFEVVLWVLLVFVIETFTAYSCYNTPLLLRDPSSTLFHFGVSLLKLSSRKTGILILKGLIGNRVTFPPETWSPVQCLLKGTEKSV